MQYFRDPVWWRLHPRWLGFMCFQESDYFTPQGEFRVDKAGSPTLLNCLMYKMSYYRFGEMQVRSLKTPAGSHWPHFLHHLCPGGVRSVLGEGPWLRAAALDINVFQLRGRSHRNGKSTLTRGVRWLVEEWRHLEGLVFVKRRGNVLQLIMITGESKFIINVDSAPPSAQLTREKWDITRQAQCGRSEQEEIPLSYRKEAAEI